MLRSQVIAHEACSRPRFCSQSPTIFKKKNEHEHRVAEKECLQNRTYTAFLSALFTEAVVDSNTYYAHIVGLGPLLKQQQQRETVRATRHTDGCSASK